MDTTGNVTVDLSTEDLSLRQLQDESFRWTLKNFGHLPMMAHHPLLGAVEEIGELAHAHLKLEQGIRGSKEELIEKSKDAVGDTIIYLADYCNRCGFDLQDIVTTTWRQVEARDWVKNNKDGQA